MYISNNTGKVIHLAYRREIQRKRESRHYRFNHRKTLAKEVEELRMYKKRVRMLLIWLAFLGIYKWIMNNVQILVVQQGALAQMDDSYSGFITNQNAPNMINAIFLVLGIVLLAITMKVIIRRKQA